MGFVVYGEKAGNYLENTLYSHKQEKMDIGFC